MLTTAVRERPRLWTQLALIGGLLWLYDAINNLNPLRTSTAIAHGADIFRFEVRWHLDPEFRLNQSLAHHLAIGRIVGDFYDVTHFVVTLALLGWVWWRHPQRYRVLRNALLFVNLIGFAIFWAFPVAPPRMLATFGFVDIVGAAHSFGSWSTGTLASQANEYAAMPSLHVAWAIWCALAIWAIRKDITARAAVVIYALGTCLIVMATANHYFLDVAAGAITIAAAAGLARLVQREPLGERPAA